MKYIQIADDLFIPEVTVVTPKVVRLSEIQAQRDEILASQNQEPTQEELLEYARHNHPHFVEREIQDLQLSELECTISELECTIAQQVEINNSPGNGNHGNRHSQISPTNP